MEILLVMTNMPTRESAEKLAGLLIEARLAACVNILSPCRSVYRWKGALQNEEEIPLLIKTADDRFAALAAAIAAHHPYELPEIVAVPLSGGLPAYLQWVQGETRERENGTS